MPVVYGGDRPKYRTNPGAVQHYLVSKSVGASAVSIWTSEWQPGGGPTTKHTHPHEEVFLFLAGTGEGEVTGPTPARSSIIGEGETRKSRSAPAWRSSSPRIPSTGSAIPALRRCARWSCWRRPITTVLPARRP